MFANCSVCLSTWTDGENGGRRAFSGGTLPVTNGRGALPSCNCHESRLLCSVSARTKLFSVRQEAESPWEISILYCTSQSCESLRGGPGLDIEIVLVGRKWLATKLSEVDIFFKTLGNFTLKTYLPPWKATSLECSSPTCPWLLGRAREDPRVSGQAD